MTTWHKYNCISLTIILQHNYDSMTTIWNFNLLKRHAVLQSWLSLETGCGNIWTISTRLTADVGIINHKLECGNRHWRSWTYSRRRRQMSRNLVFVKLWHSVRGTCCSIWTRTESVVIDEWSLPWFRRPAHITSNHRLTVTRRCRGLTWPRQLTDWLHGTANVIEHKRRLTSTHVASDTFVDVPSNCLVLANHVQKRTGRTTPTTTDTLERWNGKDGTQLVESCGRDAGCDKRQIMQLTTHRRWCISWWWWHCRRRFNRWQRMSWLHLQQQKPLDGCSHQTRFISVELSRKHRVVITLYWWKPNDFC